MPGPAVLRRPRWRNRARAHPGGRRSRSHPGGAPRWSTPATRRPPLARDVPREDQTVTGCDEPVHHHSAAQYVRHLAPVLYLGVQITHYVGAPAYREQVVEVGAAVGPQQQPRGLATDLRAHPAILAPVNGPRAPPRCQTRCGRGPVPYRQRLPRWSAATRCGQYPHPSARRVRPTPRRQSRSAGHLSRW